MTKIFFLFSFLFLEGTYLYFVFFEIKKTIITKLRNDALWRDKTFENRKAVLKQSPLAITFSKFVRRHPLLFAIVSIPNSLILLLLPLIVSTAGAIGLGTLKPKTSVEGATNASLFFMILWGSYLAMCIGILWHKIKLKKYRETAGLEKAIAEARFLINKAGHP